MPLNATQRILFISAAPARGALRRSMNARGFAITFDQGREVFDQLSASSFDAVVVDLVSTADASELIKQIRRVATFRAVPIIVIGEWGTGQPSLALSAGADAFEPTPVDAERLSETIARLPKRRAAVASKGQ